MENAIEKLGLYDFFGVFVPGVAITIMGIYNKITILNPAEYTDVDIMIVIIFILESYAFGIVLQEIGALFDKKLKIRHNSRRTFLNNNNIIRNKEELKEIKAVSNNILGKNSTNNTFSEDECELVFLKCKTFLEINKMIGKAERIYSLYAMSRGLAVSSLAAVGIIGYKVLYMFEYRYIVYLLCTCYITFLLCKTSKMYSKYYIRVVFRHYIVLKSMQKSENNRLSES